MPILMRSAGRPGALYSAVRRSQQAAGAANNALAAAAVAPAPQPVANMAVPQIAAAPAVAPQRAAPQPAAVQQQQPARSAVVALRSQWEAGGPAVFPMLHRLLPFQSCVFLYVRVRNSMSERILDSDLLSCCNDGWTSSLWSAGGTAQSPAATSAQEQLGDDVDILGI